MKVNKKNLSLALTVVALTGLLWIRAAGVERQADAAYPTEDGAVRRGELLGIGEASLEGAREFVVNSCGEVTLRFKAGRAGMKTGGGIRVATGHGFKWDLWGGTQLQTSNSKAENYLTYRTSTGAGLRWKFLTLGKQYFPWQNINEFILEGADLKPGDYIEIKMGDRSGGSPGVRMQVSDEAAFTQKLYVDALGNGEFLRLRNNPQMKIVAGPAKELKVIAPSEWEAGKPAWVNVWLDDGYGNPAAGYRGAVSFEADEPAANLPGEYTFQPADAGAHRFEKITFRREGIHRIRVRDKVHGLVAESNPFRLSRAAPKLKTYWGDIHTHTMYSDGRGTPAETYDFGKRVSALDFCSVSDHDFVVTAAMWRDIIATTNRYNEPGRYVTFLAYEWSGMTDVGGDHNVYTSDPEMPLVRCSTMYSDKNPRMYHGLADAMNLSAKHVGDLFRLLNARFRNENLMVIPHYGGRHGNPAWHDPKLQRLIEVFSDHRRSEDWTTKFLKEGYRIGIMASTDNHTGNAGYGTRRIVPPRGEEGEVFSPVSPVERGTALIAARAERLTRDDVFQAMYHRQTYATTGSRILLEFEVGGLPMGSEGRVQGNPRITVRAEGTAPIKLLRIVKNGRVIHSISPRSRSVNLDYFDSGGGYEKAFYYLDLVQEDEEKAISSPVWINW